MRHFFIGESDYAASGSAFARALVSVGETVRYYAARRHEFGYPHQHKSAGSPFDKPWLQEVIRWADWIWVIQSDLPHMMGGFPAERDCMARGPSPHGGWYEAMRGKRIALLHGGSYYRTNRQYHRNLWNSFKPLSLCYEADLMGSFDNEHLVIPPLDPDWVPYYRKNWKQFRVGHYPSRPTDKGSEWILPLLRGLCIVRTSVTKPTDVNGVERTDWTGQLARMAECDVIVDQIKHELDGKQFGEWVSIATETAMLGRIPIANSLNPKPYVDTYGCMPMVHICNDRDELQAEIKRLLELPDRELREEQEACRAHAIEHHSLEPTGRLLLKLCR